MSGELALESSSGEIVIKRTSSKLSITVDGTQIPGTKSDIEKKLYDLICLGLPEVLEVLSYRRQSSGGYFSGAEDQKIKSFLSTCIPSLDKLEAVHDESKAKIAVYKHEATIKKTEAERYRASLSEMVVSPDVIPLLQQKLSILDSQLAAGKEAPEDSYIDQQSASELESLQNTLAQHQARIDDIANNEYKPTESEFTEYEELSKTRNTAAVKLSEIKKNLSEIESQYSGLYSTVQSRSQEIADLVRPKKEIPTLQLKVEALNSQLEHLNKNTCFTCHQGWDSSPEKKLQISGEISATESRISEINTGFSRSEALARSLIEEKAQLVSIENAVKSTKAEDRTLELSLATMDSQIKAVTGAYAIRKQNDLLKAGALKSETQAKIQSVVSTAKYKKSQFINELSSEISQVKFDLQRHQSVLSRATELQGYMRQAEESQALAEQRADLEFEVSDVTKKVNGLMIDGILSEVQTEANRMISSIPSVADVSVSISTVEELKNGNSKVRISSTIYKSGTPMSFKILSGGQKSAVSLVLDLAFIAVISRRTSVAPGWIFLDEAMEGMDVASKESALDLIKSVSRDRLIIIVDHSTEIKEQFDHSVGISYDGVQSKVHQ